MITTSHVIYKLIKMQHVQYVISMYTNSNIFFNRFIISFSVCTFSWKLYRGCLLHERWLMLSLHFSPPPHHLIPCDNFRSNTCALIVLALIHFVTRLQHLLPEKITNFRCWYSISFTYPSSFRDMPVHANIHFNKKNFAIIYTDTVVIIS